VARTAVSGRLSWLVATVKETRDETATARTLSLDVPGWPGHLAGQHVTAKLTAEDGYSTQRDYSIASAPEPDRFELTVQRLADGEVSPYLTGEARPGDQLEVRGPIGGWFAWPAADQRPLLLLAGGSGVVPLMSMIRTHAEVGSQVPVRLIYSARTAADVIYQQELSERVRVSPLTVSYLYTRTLYRPASAPQAAQDLRPGGGRVLRRYGDRLDATSLAEVAFSPQENPAIFVCGPTGFVEAASDLLVAAGHPPGSVRTERFGATG
jgi:ferredoxin-NADP reductase